MESRLFWDHFYGLLFVCVAFLILCCIWEKSCSAFYLFFLLIFMWNSDEKRCSIALTVCHNIKCSKMYSCDSLFRILKWNIKERTRCLIFTCCISFKKFMVSFWIIFTHADVLNIGDRRLFYFLGSHFKLSFCPKKVGWMAKLLVTRNSKDNYSQAIAKWLMVRFSMIWTLFFSPSSDLENNGCLI